MLGCHFVLRKFILIRVVSSCVTGNCHGSHITSKKCISSLPVPAMQSVEKRNSDSTNTSSFLNKRTAELLDLPSELVVRIAEQLSPEHDLNSFVRACRSTFALLNSQLYRQSAEQDKCSEHDNAPAHKHRQNNFAILWAAKTGSIATAEKALENGANINVEAHGFTTLAMNTSGRRRRKSPTSRLVQICCGIHGKTPLILAAESGDTDMIRLLLAQPDIDVTTTALDMATTHWAALNGHAKALELLLTQTALDPNQESLGITPILLAASNGHADVVAMLSKRNDIKINATNPFGLTALHLAAINGHWQTVKVLLEHPKTEVNAKDKDDNTPLHLAIGVGCPLSINALLDDTRTDISARDGRGYTPACLMAGMDSEGKLNWRPRLPLLM